MRRPIQTREQYSRRQPSGRSGFSGSPAESEAFLGTYEPNSVVHGKALTRPGFFCFSHTCGTPRPATAWITERVPRPAHTQALARARAHPHASCEAPGSLRIRTGLGWCTETGSSYCTQVESRLPNAIHGTSKAPRGPHERHAPQNSWVGEGRRAGRYGCVRWMCGYGAKIPN